MSLLETTSRGTFLVVNLRIHFLVIQDIGNTEWSENDSCKQKTLRLVSVSCFSSSFCSECNWLNVHRGFTAAAVVGILYLIPFYILEWKVSAPLFSEPQGGTDTDPVTNKRSE